MKRFLPYTRQIVTEADIAAVVEVLRSDYLTTGPVVNAFEDALATEVGAAFVIACSSGTAALHLAALALGLGPGDTVIVPTVTFAATANGPRFTGANVIFADVDPDTGLMRPSDMEAAIARSPTPPRAVYPVHLGGQPCDMAAINAIAGQAGISVVEDAAHALGTAYDDEATTARVGGCTQSDMAIFSFHPAKTVAMGEGGAVTTNDEVLAARVREYCAHGIVRDNFKNGTTRDPWYYEMQKLGFNYRASDIHCALGLSQLSRLETVVRKREHLVSAYDTALAELAPVIRPTERVPSDTTGWHLYQVLIDFEAVGLSRAELINHLRENGIGTQVHYIPVHSQPYYQRLRETPMPGAEAFYQRCLSLPLFSEMDEGDVLHVVENLKTALL
ncbi:MAG: UDP-4-amino-4,6-dideoxy-N-acetyl-beta-L-altrosamine transaminase [Alphaproteobacteria bacterium]|nr:UDP-4-amino-4,6-dideoxy-N-acetyl-beta-L-altrosamine transaminase [Alphaproteobacteria bacterium]